MRLALRRGDVAARRAGAIVTSANDSLCGNRQPDYWRFSEGSAPRRNVDGAVRDAAGPDLAFECDALPVVASDARRDIARWAPAVKRGWSASVRCPAGSAVATRAGRLDADWIVHARGPRRIGAGRRRGGDSERGGDADLRARDRSGAQAVAPDIELTFGRYKGRASYRPAGARDADRLPEELLRDAYAAAFDAAAADRAGPKHPIRGTHLWTAFDSTSQPRRRCDPSQAAAGAESVACPALGAGVKGWAPEITAAFGLEAAARCRDLGAVDFVVDDAAFEAWASVATALLGEASDGEHAWVLAPRSDDAATGDALPLVDVPEVGLPRTLWARRRADVDDRRRADVGGWRVRRGGGSRGWRRRRRRVAGALRQIAGALRRIAGALGWGAGTDRGGAGTER